MNDICRCFFFLLLGLVLVLVLVLAIIIITGIIESIIIYIIYLL